LEKKKTPEKKMIYVKNPDVVLREEDPDGALLFNPDTNQIKVLNPTALFLWKLCEGKYDVAAAIKKLQEGFKKVPADKVEEQVNNYFKDMVKSGFIGIAE